MESESSHARARLVEVLLGARACARVHACAIAQPSLTVEIVLLALLFVRQDFVRFRDLLEFLLAFFFVVRILVRMVL